MTEWAAFSAADFDAAQADKRAARAARQAAEAGQAGLFFVATPQREAKRAAVPSPELAGQFALFAEPDTESPEDRRERINATYQQSWIV